MRMGGVFDHLEAMSTGDRHDRVHVGRVPAEMNRNYRPGTISDAMLDVVGVEAQRVTLDISEDNRSAQRHCRRA